MEIWKTIEELSDYQISNYGQIKSFKCNKEKIVILENQKGYKVLRRKYQGKLKNFKIHRLVAKYFLPNPNNYPIVNHKDENRGNNNVDNLEWCTFVYNSQYSKKITLERKLTLIDINDMYNLSQSGHSLQKIGELYHIDTTAIHNFLKYLHPLY